MVVDILWTITSMQIEGVWELGWISGCGGVSVRTHAYTPTSEPTPHQILESPDKLNNQINPGEVKSWRIITLLISGEWNGDY